MLPKIDLPRALLRGRYMAAAARMEWQGIPIDVELLNRLRKSWARIKHRMIAAIDANYRVFEPADRRPINPQSTLGKVLLNKAREWNINPHDLADAVDTVWLEERDIWAETIAARKAARKATGLTVRRIGAREKAGKDPESYPAIDSTAHMLASAYPALGIDHGSSGDDEDDGMVYSELLWEVLRKDDPRIKPRHDADILRRATDMVKRAGDSPRPFGAVMFSTERFTEYLVRAGILWPRLDSNRLALNDNTLKEMARAYPAEIGPLREVLRLHRGELKRIDQTVGADGRNRYLFCETG